MKSIILAAAVLLATAGSLSAQNFPPDYRFEIGVNGGMSANTIPKGPASSYQGTKGSWAPEFSVRGDYNISQYLQVGIDLGFTNWTTTANWTAYNAYGENVPAREVKFVLAKPAISFAAQVNGMIPFFSRYKEYNKANIYYGATIGIITTINDGSIAYSQYNEMPGSQYTYASQYNYGNGIGYVAGLQVGFSYFITQRWGINAELAGRYADVGTTDTHYGHENSRYNLFYFPCTVGIRYRF